jgi:hypothetical protein
MYFDNFLETLPIIGYSLIGIFGVIGVIIGVVYLLNKFSAWVETRGENKNEN